MYLTQRTFIRFLTIGIILCVTQITMAQSDSESYATLEEASRRIYGIIEIEKPRETKLLQLRGISGRGVLTFQCIDDTRWVTIPIRFVAGDFNGRRVLSQVSGPIRMALLSQQVARTLLDGQDVVSDMYRVSQDPQDTDADILILDGLSTESGFVLNPGRSFLNDIFGLRVKEVSCIDEFR